MIRSYPHILALGHAALGRELFAQPTIYEEKVDGSQISFGVTIEGELEARSRGAELSMEHPDSMFAEGIAAIKLLKDVLRRGWVYRGEYLKKPKQCTLKYDRIPVNHVMIFDINTGLEAYLSCEEKVSECARIGLECVPLLARRDGAPTIEDLNTLLERESVLGGVKIEGVVIKPADYSQFGKDGKALMAKYVSEKFKETHRGEWKRGNPSGKDIIATIVANVATEARWEKAVQHLRDAGRLTGTPKDIGELVHEVPNDISESEHADMMETLRKWAWPQIARGSVRGMAEWYKKRLMQEMIDEVHMDKGSG